MDADNQDSLHAEFRMHLRAFFSTAGVPEHSLDLAVNEAFEATIRMLKENVAETPICPACKNTGWRPTDVAGVSSPCDYIGCAYGREKLIL